MLGFTVCKAENQFAVILSKSEGLRIGARETRDDEGYKYRAENYGLLCGRTDKHSSSRREERIYPLQNLPSKD